MSDNSLVHAVGPDNFFDTGAQAVPAGTLTAIGRIQGCRGRRLLIEGTVGAGGALNHFTISRAAVPGGTQHPMAADAAFNTLGNEILGVDSSTSPANVHETTASGSFQIHLDGGADEYEFYAEAATTPTTLQIHGTAYRIGQ